MKLHCLALFLLLFSAEGFADVKPLPQSQWPRTVAEAVPHIVAAMTPTTRSVVSRTSKDSLFLFMGEWGDDIEQLVGLDKGNKALIENACGQPCPVKQVTLLLMEAAWATLDHDR